MKDVLRLSLPLTLWLISFSALYGLHAVICALEWGEDGRVLLLAAGSLVVLTQGIALLLLLGNRFGAKPGFARTASLSLATVALVAAVWTSAPVLLLPMCQG